MIQINDNDSPITAAEKIINGTKYKTATLLDKAAYKAFTGKEVEDTVLVDMFDLEDVKEIADYLMCYYNNHKDRE